ncbi:hypothetical protein [Mameliella alba]|uniref:hypothetical protein n=1 Tax=Mameliella alba TaxID=561184 RepID=UPI000B5355F9|nr:hypothetical protein [Mameliella alba]OWV44231.1 hypothetical protein CDZ95_05975 [Mameliella alba]
MLTNAPFTEQIDAAAGWAIFEALDYYADGCTTFFGVHEETGEVREADVTGWHIGTRHYLDLRAALPKLAALGFPKRTGNSPLTIDEIDALYAAQFHVEAAE